MSIRTILAPGVQINEIDKSQYSPAMAGSNCYVMGFTEKGEPYAPMEFTSRTAWTSYYGAPKNEAERYSYAAACEALNANGRLFFARLPYDNPSLGKVACFRYDLAGVQSGGVELSADGPFGEVVQADPQVDNVVEIRPSSCPVLCDLSAVEAWRTDEAKVANNTFVIASTSFNTYGKVVEDWRKGRRTELIGVLPVVTTAANAMYAQRLIDVPNYRVCEYETVGAVKTLDASTDSELVSRFPWLSAYTSNTVRDGDVVKPLNTRSWYQWVDQVRYRDSVSVDLVADITAMTDDELEEVGRLSAEEYINQVRDAVPGTWSGDVQLIKSRDGEGQVYKVEAGFSFVRAVASADLCEELGDAEFYANWYSKYGWHNPDGDDSVPDTLSREANTFFPTIDFDGEHFVRDHLKKIGIVVYRMFLDPSEGNKINFQAVEAFAGSLCPSDKDDMGRSVFIDEIVNSQSKYINVFSNCFQTPADKKYYTDKMDAFVLRPGQSKEPSYDAAIEYVKDFPEITKAICDDLELPHETVVTAGDATARVDQLVKLLVDSSAEGVEKFEQAKRAIVEKIYKAINGMPGMSVAPSLGFYQDMTRDDISVSRSVYDGMNRCFDKASDINQFDVDIVPDAGLANIASCIMALYGDRGRYDLAAVDDMGNSLMSMWKCDSATSKAVKTWKTVEQKLDNFCKNVRKDCMFIADGPRPLVLAGQKKVVRPTKPDSSIDVDIIPYLKCIGGLNTSYGAGYLDWFQQADDYSGDFFWCPPSIKAMGVYVNCDLNYNYWDAPAGLNRGVIQAVDVAFSPTVKQAGSIYEKNFNYAINYPQDGIVLEGQKTLQVKPSAFDRVNVRRLFLRLERAAWRVARYFVYEGNTAYTRQRLVDALDPYFKEVKLGGGIYDYKIKSDETNNTDDVIDRNELRVAIGIKPTKTAEFIMIDFVALRTGGSWTEAGF